jgi:SnoaL-like domain
MKAKTLLAALPLLLSAACTSQQGQEMTPQQKDQIKSEVRAVGDSAFATFQRMDWTGGLQFYADTPDWVMFNADGSQWDYQATTKAMTDMTDISHNPVTAWKWTTTRQHFMVVNQDVVIGAWIGKDETIMKSGDTVLYDPHVYTLVFKRIAGQWKIVWSHDSGLPVTHKAVVARRPRR